MPAFLQISAAVERDHASHAWLERLPGELGAVARIWFTVVRRAGPDVRELLHDGFATACV